MTEFKAIQQLPELDENQEWCCEGGCSNVQPKLYRHVYQEQWNPEGVKVVEKAENYYTCQRGHVLAVWDEDQGDYVQLPEENYQEPENKLGFDIHAVQALGLQLWSLEENHKKASETSDNPLMKMFKNATASIGWVNDGTGEEHIFNMNQIKELEAFILKDEIMNPDRAVWDGEDNYLNGLCDQRAGQKKIRVNIENL